MYVELSGYTESLFESKLEALWISALSREGFYADSPD
jgi:hypothetical protein